MSAGLVASIGCGGASGTDLTGIYQVTSHTVNDTGCAEGPAVADPPYIAFERSSFFGQTYYSYSSCTDATGTNCSGGGLLSLPYFEAVAGGRRAVISAASGTVPTCTLSYTESTAILAADGTLRIETRRYGEQITIATDAECSSDTASARGASMPCQRFEAISATLSAP